jgi:hypothetical protein
MGRPRKTEGVLGEGRKWTDDWGPVTTLQRESEWISTRDAS